MSGVTTVGSGLLGLGIVMVMTPLILRASTRARIHRIHDLHHTNSAPVPRLGGLALAGAFVGVECFLAVFFPQQRAPVPARAVIILSSLAMFGLGFWDDLKPLGAKRKLLGQVLIASIVCYAGIGVESLRVPFTERIIALNGWGTVLTVLWLVGITNLINLIDGVDGLAGGICLMLMGLLVYVGHENGTFVFLTAGMTGALLGFLFFNFPPARIYLGDGGAYFLGFQIGLFSIVGSHKGTMVSALMAPLFVLALPIVDTALAILRRGLRGLPLLRADRRHIHHHLLRAGMSRRRVVLSLYGITLLFLMMGFAAFWSRGHWIPVLLGLGLIVLLLCAGKLNFTREWFAVGRVLGNSLAMRQQIQYGLSLTEWLAQEGKRCASLEDFFQDLVFAARRLGFSAVKMTLADGQRTWSEPGVCDRIRSNRQSLQGGKCGVLELEAPICRLSQGGPLGPLLQGVSCRATCDPTRGDPRLFEIMSELLAESCVRATHKFNPLEAPLRFDLKLLPVGGVPRRARLAVAPSSGTGEPADKPSPPVSGSSSSG